MDVTRREFLEAAGATLLADTFPDDVSQRAAKFISGYSAEGFHRTATRVDRASAERLVTFARDAGAEAKLEPLELSRVDPGPAFVEIDSQRIDGLPMFDGTFTGTDGVRGVIGAAGTDAAIGRTRIAPNGEAPLRRLREGSPHQAIVVVTAGAHPGLCPVNAQYFSAPFGPPALQVGSEHSDVLDAAVKAGREIRVVAHATRRQATAFNVVADIAGTRRDLPPLCVMTPRTGWHYNAAERGGGLVCWLDCVRAAAAARPPRTVRFVASSGHELGHLGLHDYLHRRSSLARDSLAWLHFGANIGTTRGTVTTTCSEKSLEETAVRAFEEGGAPKVNLGSPERAAGEAATIRAQGGRCISLIGSNEWFHNPADRWPDAVDIADVVRFAKASAALAVALANRLS